VDFFNIAELEQLEGLEADVRQRVQGDPSSEAAGDDVAVWNFGSVITSEDGLELNVGTYTVCLDRRSAEAVDCDVDEVDGDDVDIEGLTLTFPFGTEQRDYEVFNSTTRQAWPATFEGVEEVGGLETYRFEVDIPETVVRSLEVPAALAGSDEDGVVEADAVYSNVRTIWVEPTSGVIVTSEEDPNTVLKGPEGTTGATILAGHFAGSEQTIADGVERAEDFRSQITLVKTVLPLSMAGVGLLLVIVGALLVARRSRGGAHREDDSDYSEDRPVATV
jgi:hypothetical protein